MLQQAKAETSGQNGLNGRADSTSSAKGGNGGTGNSPNSGDSFNGNGGAGGRAIQGGSLTVDLVVLIIFLTQDFQVSGMEDKVVFYPRMVGLVIVATSISSINGDGVFGLVLRLGEAVKQTEVMAVMTIRITAAKEWQWRG